MKKTWLTVSPQVIKYIILFFLSHNKNIDIADVVSDGIAEI